MRPPRNRAPPPGKELRPGVPLTVKKAIFDGRPEPPPPPPPPPAEFNEPEADEAMRVVLVRNLHDAADAPTDAEMRRAWMDELVDEVRRAPRLPPISRGRKNGVARPPKPHDTHRACESGPGLPILGRIRGADASARRTFRGKRGLGRRRCSALAKLVTTLETVK